MFIQMNTGEDLEGWSGGGGSEEDSDSLNKEGENIMAKTKLDSEGGGGFLLGRGEGRML